MPVMKSQLARPAMKEAVVLDLGDIGAQAEKLRRAAEAKAQQIIDTAQQRADELAEGAAERGQAAGFEQGQAAGFEQGVVEGRAQALAESQQRLAEVSDTFLNLAAQWDAGAHQVHREAQQAVLEFALRLAEKVVHRVIEVDRTVVVDQVAHAMSHVLAPLDAVVQVNPDDVPILAEAMPQLVKELPGLDHVNLEATPDLTPGGCRIAFGDGQVDATIEKQLARIVDYILPLDTPADQADEGPDASADAASADRADAAASPAPPEAPPSDISGDASESAPDADADPPASA